MSEEIQKYKGGSMSVNLAQYQPTPSTETLDRKGWLKYGDDNLYPTYLKELAETSPTHGALVKGIAKMIAGKTLTASNSIDQGKVVSMKVERIWKAICNDVEMFGGFYIERIKTLDRKGVARVEHLPFENCRLAVHENMNVTGVYYSRNWAAINKPINKPRYIALKGLNADAASEVCVSFVDECTSTFYPIPSYKSAINYIEIDRQIPIFHVSSILNGFFPSTIVSLFNGEPDPKAKQEMKSYFNKQTGAENAGQIMLLFNEPTAQAPVIETFQLTDADKMYETLSRQAMEKIMIGHLVTTPLLFGVRGEGSGFSSNADELRQGFKIFTENVIEPYRMEALQTLMEASELRSLVVTPNSYVEGDVIQENGTPTADAGEDVASQALNGAQIESLVNIITQATASTIPIETAKALVAAGFPMLTTDQIENIFKDIVPGSIPQEAVLRSVILSQVQKKKIEFSSVDMTDTDEDSWLSHLFEKGEIIDEDEWEEVEEMSGQVSSIEDEESIHAQVDSMNKGAVEMYQAYANPDSKSEMDGGIYKVRYGYPTKFSANSRRFCKAMAQAASAGVIYRYEDIVRMGDEGVNGGFAAKGESSYSIFLYKGGANCHHYWTRKVFKRKREKGKILKNDGLKNDERISQSQANKAGFDFKDNEYWSEASTRPIDMPNHGYKN